MSARTRVAAGCGLLTAFVLSLNVFGRELDALFLRYSGIDKALHVSGYLAVYAFVFWLAGRLTQETRMRVRWAVAVALLISAVDESLQALMPARNLEAFDVVANGAGIAFGWLLVRRRADRVALFVAAAAACAAVYVGWDTHARLADYSRALQYVQHQDFVSARQHLRRALDAGLRTPALFNELGWVEIESGVGDPRKAVEYAETALSMRPGNPDILDTYGWALHHAGRPNEALEVLQRAYAARPNMYCIHYHLGAAYLAAGERAKAEFHFSRQVERRGTREAIFARRALERMGSDQ